MPLKGTIQEFGVADIFQLIGMQSKSGILSLSNDRDRVRVHFDQGKVVRAESDKRPAAELLGAMLLDSELVKKDQIELAIAEQHRRSSRDRPEGRLGLILEEMGFVSKKDLEDMLQIQLQETVFQLFRWEGGTYEFEGSDTKPSIDEGIRPLRADAICLEALRRQDEWPGIRRLVPSYDVELEKKGKPLPAHPTITGEFPEMPSGAEGFDGQKAGTSGPASPSRPGSPPLSRAAYKVWAHIGPGRDLNKIIQLTRLGEFETLRGVHQLVSGGYVSLHPTKPPEPPSAEASAEAAAAPSKLDSRPAEPAQGFGKLRICPRCQLIYVGDLRCCGVEGDRIDEHDGDPLIGKTIDRFHIIELLGSGARGRVYRAKHGVLDREYAFKVFFAEVVGGAETLEQFRLEAQVVSKLNHPNVVSVFDFGTTRGGLTFLAMELVTGQTLDVVIFSHAPLPEARAARIASGIAEGLGALHHLGFAHRDLKPSNVALLGSGEHEVAKILDFGLAALMPGQAADASKTAGATQGDLRALGLILYQMLTGKTVPDDLPKDLVLAPLVRALLDEDASARPKSAAQVIVALKKALPEPRAADKPRPASPSRYRIALEGLILALLVAVYFQGQKPSSPPATNPDPAAVRPKEGAPNPTAASTSTKAASRSSSVAAKAER